MKTRLCHVLLLVYVLLIYATPAFAHQDQNEHYSDIEYVLFGKDVLTKSERESTVLLGNPAKDALISLEHATAIALDQYKGDDQSLLDQLCAYSIQGLPPDTKLTKEEHERGINFIASFSTHRSHTHRGWTYDYHLSNDIANWPVRKNIMLETAKVIFDSDYIDNNRLDAFCALIYYIHVLGDFMPDSKEKDGAITISLIQPNASTRNLSENTDIFLELQTYLPILFKDKQGDWSYNRLLNEIKTLRNNACEKSKTYKSFPDKNNPDAMKEYHEIAQELYSVLCTFIPRLIERETFFNTVFIPLL